MSRFCQLINNQVLRFLVTGGLNTIVTYGIYLLLKGAVGYQIAYLISYVSGILFSYFMSAIFVFRKKISLRTFSRFPVIYVIQYAVGALLLGVLIHTFSIPTTIAPLLVILVTLPLTFILSRFVLLRY